MKTLSVRHHLLWLPAFMLLCTSLLSARLSEPSVTYYGTVFDGGGNALTNGEALVIARLHNNECSRTYTAQYDAENVNYSLRLAIDDGFGYRYVSHALRQGEHPDIFVVLDGIEWGCEDPLPPAGPPASLQRADIRAVPEPITPLVVLCSFVFSLYTRCRR